MKSLLKYYLINKILISKNLVNKIIIFSYFVCFNKYYCSLKRVDSFNKKEIIIVQLSIVSDLALSGFNYQKYQIWEYHSSITNSIRLRFIIVELSIVSDLDCHSSIINSIRFGIIIVQLSIASDMK